MLCGHVVHSECVDRFVEVTGKRKEEACPLKCHTSNTLQVIEEEEAPEQPSVDDTGMEGSDGRGGEGEEAMKRIS